MSTGRRSESIWPNGAVTPSDRARNQPSMTKSTPPAQNGADTTPTMTVDDDSCGCSPELACFQHYLEGARGLPAVVPVSHTASDVDWEAHG